MIFGGKRQLKYVGDRGQVISHVNGHVPAIIVYFLESFLAILWFMPL